MRKILMATVALSMAATMSAQSAIDAYMLSQTQTRGTARFMSMGGAFTALGGDISTLTQNPAGIGVYRRSEISATLAINPMSTTSQTSSDKLSTSWTTVNCNNFGYIGTASLSGGNTFSWGASYNRAASFDRRYSIYEFNAGTSLSDYIAYFTNNLGADMLSDIAYSCGLISTAPDGRYTGLSLPGTASDFLTNSRENGYVDEYAIDFGGNVNDLVMWGIGFGITDLSYSREDYYDESLANAWVPLPNSDGQLTENCVQGDAGFDITNYRHINGTGFNLKLGVILKPVNELRIGLAFHTPTWYTLTSNAWADVNYRYYYPQSDTKFADSYYSDNDYYNFRLTTPWKFMAGIAGVLGSSAIISVDYEYQAFNKMRTSYQGQFGNYFSDDYTKENIGRYYKGVNILRVGAEYRLTPSFSVRAGYNYSSEASTDYLKSGDYVSTDGLDTSYTVNGSTNAVSVGLGYRYKIFSIDGAYVWRHRNATYKPYTNYLNVESPAAKLSETVNSIVLTASIRF